MTYAVIRVTMRQDYLVPTHDEEVTLESKTVFDGKSLKEIEKEWFYNHSLNSYHATRDSRLSGGSVVMVGTEIIDADAPLDENVDHHMSDRLKEIMRHLLYMRTDLPESDREYVEELIRGHK